MPVASEASAARVATESVAVGVVAETDSAVASAAMPARGSVGAAADAEAVIATAAAETA